MVTWGLKGESEVLWGAMLGWRCNMFLVKQDDC